MEKGGAQQCDQQSTGPRNPPNHRLSPPLSIRRHGCSRRATRWEPAVGTWRASAWSTLIQQITRNGEVIVMFFAALASGQPFMMQYVKELEMTDEQKAVAYGIATDAQKAMAKRQRRFVVLRRPYYPNMEEMTAAMNWLAERGFGKAPKTVQIEGSVTAGFKMVFRRWAPGTDPASLPLAEMPKQIVVSERKMLEAPKNHHQNDSG